MAVSTEDLRAQQEAEYAQWQQDLQRAAFDLITLLGNINYHRVPLAYAQLGRVILARRWHNPDALLALDLLEAIWCYKRKPTLRRLHRELGEKLLAAELRS